MKDRRREAGRDDREVEDVVGVDVLRRRKCGDGAIQTSGADDGKLGLEGNPFFKHTSWRSEFAPNRLRIDLACEFDLSFSIVTKIRCLQHRRRADFSKRLAQAGCGVHHTERRARESICLEEGFFPLPVLANVQHFASRPLWSKRLHRLHSRARDVFEFKGNDIHPLGKSPQRGGIGVGGVHFDIAYLAGRAVGLRFVGMHAVAHAARGDGQHTAELPASKYAHDASRLNGIGFRQRGIPVR